MAILYFLNAIQDYSTAKHKTIGVAASARNVAFLLCFARFSSLVFRWKQQNQPLHSLFRRSTWNILNRFTYPINIFSHECST
jgi:hypothetical protein